MSHTYQITDRWTVICNSDFSGPIEVLDHRPEDTYIPVERIAEGIATYVLDIELFEGIIAHIIRQKKIARLEQTSDEQIIYGDDA